jgi:hypothetical protein
LLGRQIEYFGAIDIGVVELPLVVVEVTPAGYCRMSGDGFPSLMPDRPGADIE